MDRIKLNAYQLARLADCASPDSLESAGAAFLVNVADTWQERASDGSYDRDDTPWEIADAAPSVYTFTRWQEFTDLAAWQEDADEVGGLPADMTDAAGVCLYLIAERLVNALTDEEGLLDCVRCGDALPSLAELMENAAWTDVEQGWHCPSCYDEDAADEGEGSGR